MESAESQKPFRTSTCHFGPFGCLPADIWILLAHKYLPHSVICRLTSINSSLNELFSSARVHRAKKRICKTTPSLIAQYKYEDTNFALQPQKGNAFLPDGRPILWIRKTEEGIQAGDNTKAVFFLGILNFVPTGATETSDCNISWTRISPMCYSGVEGLQVSSSRRLIYFLQILEDKKRICLETLDLAGQSISSHELDVLFLPSPVHYAIQTQFILDESQQLPRFIIIQPFLRKATLITFSSETAYCLSKFEFAPEIRNRLQLQSIVAALDSKSIYLATNRIVVQISLADLKQQTLLMLHPHRKKIATTITNAKKTKKRKEKKNIRKKKKKGSRG